MADIKIQRGVSDIGNTGGTASPSTDFNSLSSTFVLNSNNRRQNAGSPSYSNNIDGDDLSGGIYLSAVDTIQFDRESGSRSDDHRFAWEAWEYTGSSGGDNEFIVRGRYQLTLTDATTTQAVSSISDINNCIPFITGIFTDSGGDDADSSTAKAWMSSTGTLNVKRGSGSNNTVKVYVVVVEFTGSNWQVAHGDSGSSSSDTGTITLVDDADGTTSGGGDIGDWDNAIIFHQFCANSANGTDDSISDTSAVYYPNANTTQVDWEFDANHVDSVGDASHLVHVLKHDDMAITRYTDTDSSAGANDVDITSASLDSLDTSAVEVSRRSSGTGTAYGRGWVNIRLTSTTNVELWVHRSGNTISTRIQVADLSAIESSSGETINGASSLTSSSELVRNFSIIYDMSHFLGDQFGISDFDDATTTLACIGTVDEGSSGATHYGISDFDDATATLECVAECDKEFGATLASSATLTAEGGRDRASATAITASTTLSVIGSTVKHSALALVASTALLVAGHIDKNAQLDISSSSTMEAVSFADRYALLDISSNASLSAIPEVTGIKYGRTNLSTTTALIAIGSEESYFASSLSATSTLKVEAQRDKNASIYITGDATLNAIGQKDSRCNASLSSSSTLNAIASLDKSCASALSSSTTLSAISNIDKFAEWVGTRQPLTDDDGNILTDDNGDDIYIDFSAVILDVNGSVSSGSSASLSATSTLSCLGEIDRNATSNLISTFTLNSNSEADRNAEIELFSTATLSVTSKADKSAESSLSSTATLNTSAEVEISGKASLSATSTLSGTAFSDGEINGKANLNATTILNVTGNNTVSGESALTSNTIINGDGEVDRYSNISISSSALFAVMSSVEKEAELALIATATLSCDCYKTLNSSASLSSDTTLSVVGEVVVESEGISCGAVNIIDDDGVNILTSDIVVNITEDSGIDIAQKNIIIVNIVADEEIGIIECQLT